jgi:hypothetical protein
MRMGRRGACGLTVCGVTPGGWVQLAPAGARPACHCRPRVLDAAPVPLAARGGEGLRGRSRRRLMARLPCAARHL